MALPDVEQVPDLVEGSTDALAISFAGASIATNSLIASVAENSGARTYTWTDDKGGGSNTYTKLTALVDDGFVQISHSIQAGAATTLTNTVDASSGQNRVLAIYEISDTDDGIAFDVEGSFDRGANSTDHFCAAVGEIDTAPNVFVVCVGAHNADAGAHTQGSGYTPVGVDVERNFHQFKTSASALTDDRGAFTSAESRHIEGVMASFKGGVAAPVAVPTWHPVQSDMAPPVHDVVPSGFVPPMFPES